MTGSASQAMDVVYGLLLGEKIMGGGVQGGGRGSGFFPGGRLADDGKRLWCWTLYVVAPAGAEEMLLKMMKIYMDKGGGSGRGNGNGIGA